MNSNQWDQYADLVDDRIGDGGDELHATCIDPLILSYDKPVARKRVIDLGCGNAYLFNKLDGISSYIGIDSSPALLEKAKRRYGHLPAVTFMHADITTPLTQLKGNADIVIANMVLQYADNLGVAARNIADLLQPGGTCAVIIDHPGHALFLRAQTLAGKPDTKFIDADSYFTEGKRRKRSLWGKAELTYYHRTIATYVNAFSGLLQFDRMDEVSPDGEMPRIFGMKWSKSA